MGVIHSKESDKINIDNEQQEIIKNKLNEIKINEIKINDISEIKTYDLRECQWFKTNTQIYEIVNSQPLCVVNTTPSQNKLLLKNNTWVYGKSIKNNLDVELWIKK